ncbi:MAG: ABC transporter permease [Bryobacteraceae bacterium]|nr:ABC transporter permease [Bryobacteraceae bacterium]
MNFPTLRVLFRKEMLDLLRDRRTLISLVIAPMLVGPAIMTVMNYYIRRSEQQAKVERYKVGLNEGVRISGLRDALNGAGLEVSDEAAPRQAVVDKKITFGIDVTGDPSKPKLMFYSDNSEMKTSMARARVNEAIDKVWRERIRSELAARNVPESVIQPFERSSVNVAQPRKMTGSVIGRIIGFLLLIFLFNGAMYSAVDSTAGEKERKTIEILLASAAGRTEIVAAKVLTAMVTSFGTTVLSISSYALALAQTGSRSKSGDLVFPTDPLTLGLLVLLILPVALMASCISIAAATPARSTREAMSYLTPGLFLIMFLGMFTFIVDGPPSIWMALIPFSNFSQMMREVLSGDWTWAQFLMTTAANLVYSLIAVALAVRAFRTEKVLFRS